MAGLLVLAAAGEALAEEGSKGPSEVIFLTQLIVLMLVGRLLGEAMQRIGQPSVMGQLARRHPARALRAGLALAGSPALDFSGRPKIRRR